MQTQQSVSTSSTSQSALPADFSFHRIGKPPSLLTRLGDALPGELQGPRTPSTSLPSTSLLDRITTTPSGSTSKKTVLPLSERLAYPAEVTPPPPASTQIKSIPGSATLVTAAAFTKATIAALDLSKFLPSALPLQVSPPASLLHSTNTSATSAVVAPMQPQPVPKSTPAIATTTSIPTAVLMDVDIPSSATMNSPKLSSIPSPPLPNVTADVLYTKLASLAGERTAWDDIKHHFQRCREEREELLRRHEDVMRAAQRGKEQADRVLSAAEAAFQLVESLRDKQEQRWEQEKVLVERAYAETLRLQQEQNSLKAVSPRTSPSSSIAQPTAPNNITQLPPHTQVLATSAPDSQTPAASVASSKSNELKTPANSAAANSVAQTAPVAPPSAALVTTNGLLKPPIAQTQTVEPSFIPETPLQRRKREELERLQAQKKAEIQARKWKEQQEESARIRAARANADAAVTDAGSTHSKSATPQPPPQLANTPASQQHAAAVKQASPLATPVGPIAVQPPLKQAPSPATPATATKPTITPTLVQAVSQARTIALPPTVSTPQVQPTAQAKTNTINPTTATVTSSGAAATATNLSPKSAHTPATQKPGMSPVQPKPPVQVVAPAKQPQVSTSKSAVIVNTPQVKQEPLPEPSLAVAKSMPQVKPPPKTSLPISAASHTNIAQQVAPATQVPTVKPISSPVQSSKPAINVRDKDRPVRVSDGFATAGLKNPAIASNPPPTATTLPKAPPLPQQASISHQPATTQAQPIRSGNAAQTARQQWGDTSASDWSLDPRISMRSPTPERTPSPETPPTLSRRQGYDQYIPRRPTGSHWSPPRSPPASPPLARAAVPRLRNDDRHYSPSRSRSRSPVAEVSRKRYRESDERVVNEQPPRRAKMSEPSPARSLDWTAPSRFRQELDNSRDMARTPPRPEAFGPQVPAYTYTTQVSPPQMYYSQGYVAPAPMSSTQAYPQDQYPTRGYESAVQYSSSQSYGDYPPISPDDTYAAERGRIVSGSSQKNRQSSGSNWPVETYGSQSGNAPVDEPGLLYRMSEPKPSRGRGGEHSAASSGRGRGGRGAGRQRTRGNNTTPSGGKSLSSRINNPSLEDRLSG